MMSLYEGAKIRVIVNSESEEFEVKVGMHRGSVLSSFITVVVDVVAKLARGGVLSELLYADDSLMIIVIIKGFRNKFIKLRVF